MSDGSTGERASCAATATGGLVSVFMFDFNGLPDRAPTCLVRSKDRARRSSLLLVENPPWSTRFAPTRRSKDPACPVCCAKATPRRRRCGRASRVARQPESSPRPANGIPRATTRSLRRRSRRAAPSSLAPAARPAAACSLSSGERQMAHAPRMLSRGRGPRQHARPQQRADRRAVELPRARGGGAGGRVGRARRGRAAGTGEQPRAERARCRRWARSARRCARR